MNGPATRARLLELRRSAEAARRGRELLDEKREALLRAVLERRGDLRSKRHEAAEALATAHELLAAADVSLGRDRVDAAALAHAAARPALSLAPRRLAGVRVSTARPAGAPFRIRWGATGTGVALDDAARAFAALLPRLAALAELASATARLEAALAKTNRRLSALEKVILPSLAREIARTTAALEEEERDHWVRCRRAAGANHASS